jgi:hypothetical protein
VRIRWTGNAIQGMFHNDPNGIKTGQVVDLDAIHARRYVKAELAELVDEVDAHF